MSRKEAGTSEPPQFTQALTCKPTGTKYIMLKNSHM